LQTGIKKTRGAFFLIFLAILGGGKDQGWRGRGGGIPPQFCCPKFAALKNFGFKNCPDFPGHLGGARNIHEWGTGGGFRRAPCSGLEKKPKAGVRPLFFFFFFFFFVFPPPAAFGARLGRPKPSKARRGCFAFFCKTKAKKRIKAFPSDSAWDPSGGNDKKKLTLDGGRGDCFFRFFTAHFNLFVSAKGARVVGGGGGWEGKTKRGNFFGCGGKGTEGRGPKGGRAMYPSFQLPARARGFACWDGRSAGPGGGHCPRQSPMPEKSPNGVGGVRGPGGGRGGGTFGRRHRGKKKRRSLYGRGGGGPLIPGNPPGGASWQWGRETKNEKGGAVKNPRVSLHGDAPGAHFLFFGLQWLWAFLPGARDPVKRGGLGGGGRGLFGPGKRPGAPPPGKNFRARTELDLEKKKKAFFTKHGAPPRGCFPSGQPRALEKGLAGAKGRVIETFGRGRAAFKGKKGAPDQGQADRRGANFFNSILWGRGAVRAAIGGFFLGQKQTFGNPRGVKGGPGHFLCWARQGFLEKPGRGAPAGPGRGGLETRPQRPKKKTGPNSFMGKKAFPPGGKDCLAVPRPGAGGGGGKTHEFPKGRLAFPQFAFCVSGPKKGGRSGVPHQVAGQGGLKPTQKIAKKNWPAKPRRRKIFGKGRGQGGTGGTGGREGISPRPKKGRLKDPGGRRIRPRSAGGPKGACRRAGPARFFLVKKPAKPAKKFPGGGASANGGGPWIWGGDGGGKGAKKTSFFLPPKGFCPDQGFGRIEIRNPPPTGELLKT